MPLRPENTQSVLIWNRRAPAAWHRFTWCTAAAAPFTLMMFAVLLLLIFVPQLSLVLLKTPGG